MRRSARLTVVFFVLFAAALPVQSAEFVSCWVEVTPIPGVGAEKQVTRCRIAGGGVVDYASDTSVPATLSPAAGVDLTGDCWYLTSAATNWVYLSLFVDGDAILGWDPDPATPGGVAFATGRIARCTSEPNPAVDPTSEVWAYVTSYVHPPPVPDLSPPPGDGVTGLETYAGVSVPSLHTASLSAGGLALDVEIWVASVTIEWGDGTEERYPADNEAMSGYPDGIARHIYEIKRQDGYAITSAYNWSVRWRTVGGPWQALVVPDTATSVLYPVAEVISIISD